MPQKSPISRKRDLSEKVTISLCLSLLVCMGFHNPTLLMKIVGSPAACTTQPAFTFHVEAGVADQPDNLPAKASGSNRSRAKTTTTTTTEPPTVAAP